MNAFYAPRYIFVTKHHSNNLQICILCAYIKEKLMRLLCP
jgi:hypothetical protein